MDSTTHNYKKLLRRFLAVGLTLMMILGGTILVYGIGTVLLYLG